MQINTNLASMNVQRSLSHSGAALSTSMERLSSGLRINSSKDDAAGLAIADKMNSQIRGMTVAVRNANDGISLAQTADSAMGTMTETLQRMRDLAAQASNIGAVSGGDRDKLNTEFLQLGKELARITANTEFNGKNILDGDTNAAQFQIGAGTAADNQISITITDMTLVSGLASLQGDNLSIGSGVATNTAMTSVINAIDIAISAVDTMRASLGAVQNRFTTTISNLQSSIENQSAAKSRILDTDFAAETATLSRNQILQQAGTAMLAQANQSGQSVLSLLR
jgi:flagellin